MRLRMSGWLALTLLLAANADSSAAPDVRTKKVNGKLPEKDSAAYASGSGLIVGSKLILTNRHVVQDDNGKPYDGFHVYMGPDFKSEWDARVIAVSENYDLAIIETAKDIPFDKVYVLDRVAPLSTAVIAYGFPLGSRFGVGLTTSGGQVSRHPVVSSSSDSEEEKSIKSAIWHDALLSHGSSGGPLFSKDATLVGLNFGMLATDDKLALAVPSDVVAAFLRKNNVSSRVVFLDSIDSQQSKADPLSITVFVEAMGGQNSTFSLAKNADASIQGRVKSQLQSRLANVSNEALSDISNGRLFVAFPASAAASVKSDDIVRIKGLMDVIQILDKGILVTIDGVKFFMLLPAGGGGELRAKVGDRMISDMPVDGLFFVGAATSYTTVIGSESYMIPLLRLDGLAEDKDIRRLIDDEKMRRAENEAKEKRIAATEKEEERARIREKAAQRYLAKIRHTFSSSSGKYSIEAVAVRLDEQSVDLIRLSDGRKISIKLEKLSPGDRQWLLESKEDIRFYGPKYEGLLPLQPQKQKR